MLQKVWSAFDFIFEDSDNDRENQVFEESLELFFTFQSVWNDSKAIIFRSNYPVLATAHPIIPGHQQQTQAWGGPVLIVKTWPQTPNPKPQNQGALGWH